MRSKKNKRRSAELIVFKGKNIFNQIKLSLEILDNPLFFKDQIQIIFYNRQRRSDHFKS